MTRIAEAGAGTVRRPEVSPAPGRGRGRGRPMVFGAGHRRVFLDAVSAGATVAEAAARVGVSRNVPARHAQHDPQFAAALSGARELGRKARAERAPHGESRYNHAGCRCRRCRGEATARRLARR